MAKQSTKSVQEAATKIISIGLERAKDEAGKASPENNKLSISEIDKIDDYLKDTKALTDYFKNTFFNSFSELKDQKSTEVTEDNLFQIQAETALLRKLQIELIQKIQNDKINNGDAIMGAFQDSDVYKKYLEKDKGLNSKLQDFKDDNLGTNIPTFDSIMNDSVDDKKQFKLPNLEVTSDRKFDDVAIDLQKSMSQLEEMSKANLSFKSLEPNKQNLDKMKLFAMTSDPLLLGMMNSTEEGKKIGIAMEEKSRGAKIGKSAATIGLLVATLAISAIVTGIAAPALITALGASTGAKILVGTGIGLVTTGIGSGANMIGEKYVNTIGDKAEVNRPMIQRADKIKNMKIDDKFSKNLLRSFNKATKNLGLSITNQEGLSR